MTLTCYALASVANEELDVKGYDVYSTEYYVGYYDSFGDFYATGEVDYDWNTVLEVEFDY